MTKPKDKPQTKQTKRTGRKTVADGIAWDRVDLVLRKMQKSNLRQARRMTELRKAFGL